MLQYQAAGTTLTSSFSPCESQARRYETTRRFEALIIDDNPADRKLIEHYVKKAFRGAASASSAATLEEGLMALEGFHFDVLFLDLGLPESTGPRTVSEVAAAFPDVPIIVVTGQSDLCVVQDVIKRGAQEFLCKNNLNEDGVSAAVHHAVERHRMYRQMESLIAQNPEPIMVVSFDGVIEFANVAAHRMFCAGSEMLVGRHFDCYVEGIGKSEVELSFLDCRDLLAELNVTHIHWHRTKSQLITIRDISAQKRREQELINDRALALAVSEAKDKFLANMSHELRTPLNGIVGFSELMLSEKFGAIQPARYAGYVEDILHCGTTLLSQINDLLELAKAEANSITLTIEPLHLDSLLCQMVAQFQELAKVKNISLELDQPHTDIVLNVDRHRLSQILGNLLSNAVKFTGEGGLITLTVHDFQDHVRFSVKDTGLGIEKKEQARVFEAFSQVDDHPHRRRTEGSGLGLPIAKRLVDLHGGDIGINSDIGEGTEVYFSISKLLSWDD
ncbi:ATP-binding protein [Kordiimonas sp.]|uniref:ATP-binding protein n=1 Tax=Kordiimonas sp. TaxID=1970157 RepID=UPI003A9246EB